MLAYKLTHSVLTIGLLTCVQFAPPLIFGPCASIVADRIGAQRTLIITQVASAIITAILAILQLTHSLSETYLFIAAFAVGLMFTFALPAQSALIPALYRTTRRQQSSGGDELRRIQRWPHGRTRLHRIDRHDGGIRWVFALNAVTFAIFVGVLRKVRPLAPVPISNKSRVRTECSSYETIEKFLSCCSWWPQ